MWHVLNKYMPNEWMDRKFLNNSWTGFQQEWEAKETNIPDTSSNPPNIWTLHKKTANVFFIIQQVFIKGTDYT